MKLKFLITAASTSIIALSQSAMAQSQGDLTGMSIRILTDDCAFHACADTPETQEDANVLMNKILEARSSAASAAQERNGSAVKAKKGNNGRGLAQGQQNNDPQVVYLQFGSVDPTFNVFINGAPFAGGVFPDYTYTQADRDFIQARMEADYELYNFEFTQVQPSLGDYSTIRIGDNDANPIDLAGGILFGRADNIDFGNNDRNDDAFADASFWQLLAELDANFGTQNLANFLNLPGPLDAAGIEEFRQIAVVNQSANTSSHELGHILGLRHYDSFGAPGDGLPPARSPGEFIPVLETDQNALETLQHIMASGASAGLALNSPPFVDRFFGERSATKLAINERTRDISEKAAKGLLDLKKVVGGNPLEEGQNADGKLDIRAALVSGRINEAGEEDNYTLKLTEGQIFNAEVISLSDNTNADFVVSALALSQVQPDGSLVTVGLNVNTFEGFEPLIFDYTIPATGDYVLTVFAPEFGFNIPDFLTGDYEALAYVVEGKNGGGTQTASNNQGNAKGKGKAKGKKKG